MGPRLSELRVPIFCRRSGVAAGAGFRGGRGPSRQHLSRTAVGPTSVLASLPVRGYPNPASLGGGGSGGFNVDSIV